MDTVTKKKDARLSGRASFKLDAIHFVVLSDNSQLSPKLKLRTREQSLEGYLK
ncbi:MAG: hypothetical protein ACJAT4_002974 [Granulosicoccus sp.]|jgi:hypothetical protein